MKEDPADAKLAEAKAGAATAAGANGAAAGTADVDATHVNVSRGDPTHASAMIVVLAWAAVWIPIAWGVWMTLTKAAVLFR